MHCIIPEVVDSRNALGYTHDIILDIQIISLDAIILFATVNTRVIERMSPNILRQGTASDGKTFEIVANPKDYNMTDYRFLQSAWVALLLMLLLETL